jgi:methylated-DNA-[protein]-cysteine S-methyltransferase
MNMEFLLERFNTPTGRMLILTDSDQHLRAADWEDHEERMRQLLRRQYRGIDIRLHESRRESRAKRALNAYFDGEIDAINELSTATGGTDFQQQVWMALRQIPSGTTVSYGALAIKLGRPVATRAVGRANGANPIAIVNPCHRVIGANSSLTGYGGGLERKRWLLLHEVSMSPLPADGMKPRDDIDAHARSKYQTLIGI